MMGLGCSRWRGLLGEGERRRWLVLDECERGGGGGVLLSTYTRISAKRMFCHRFCDVILL